MQLFYWVTKTRHHCCPILPDSFWPTYGQLCRSSQTDSVAGGATGNCSLPPVSPKPCKNIGGPAVSGLNPKTFLNYTVIEQSVIDETDNTSIMKVSEGICSRFWNGKGCQVMSMISQQTAVDEKDGNTDSFRYQVKLSTAARACDMSVKQFKQHCESDPLLNPYTLGTAVDASGRNTKVNYISWQEVVAWIEQRKVFNSVFQVIYSKG